MKFIPPRYFFLIIGSWFLLTSSLCFGNDSSSITFFTFNETQQKERGIIVRPKKAPVTGIVIWAHGKGAKIENEIEPTLRPIADKGFIVIGIDYRQNGVDSLEDCRALFKWVLARKDFSKLPIYLSGFSLGARMALLTACYDAHERLKAVATIGSASEWDIAEISPVRHMKSLRVPLLIIHGEKDLVNQVKEAYQLEQLCKKYQKPYELLIIKEAGHDLTNRENWNAALERITAYFKAKS